MVDKILKSINNAPEIEKKHILSLLMKENVKL